MGASVRPDPMDAALADIRAQQKPKGDDLDAALSEIRGAQPATPGQQFSALVGQGATFGLGAKVLGAVDATNKMLPRVLGGESAPLSEFGKNYSATRDLIRGAADQGIKEHPIAGRATEIVSGGLTGALGSGAAMFEKTIGQSLMRRALASAGAGLDAGAVTGFLNADGDVADRARGAMAGGAIGAGAGLAAPVAVGAVAGGAKLAGRLGTRVAEAVAGEPASVRLSQSGSAASGLRPGAASAGASLPRANERALDKLAQRVLQSPTTLDEGKALAAGANGKPLTAMEVFGTPVQRLGRFVSSTPSRGGALLTKSLDERGMGAPSRLMGDAEEAFGAQRQNLLDKADELIAARRKNAQPLYQQAFDSPPIENEQVQSLFQNPQFRDAYARGQRIAAVEGRKLPPLSQVVQGAEGQNPTTVLNPIPVEGLHYTKLGLDDLIGAKAGGESAIGRTEARALRNRLREVLDLVDTEVPAYGQARQQFAGDSDLLDALESGRGFLKTPIDELQRTTRGLTQGEKELYHVGAVGSIRDKLMSSQDQRDLGRALAGTPDLRERMRLILGDTPELERFMKAIEQERSMVKTRNTALGGSNTYDKAADANDVNGDALGVLGTLFTGGPKAAALKVGQQVARSTVAARLNGVNEETANALAPRLTATGQDLQSLLEQITERVKQLEAANAQRAGLGRALSRSGGASAGVVANRR